MIQFCLTTVVHYNQNFSKRLAQVSNWLLIALRVNKYGVDEKVITSYNRNLQPKNVLKIVPGIKLVSDYTGWK